MISVYEYLYILKTTDILFNVIKCKFLCIFSWWAVRLNGGDRQSGVI